MSDLEHRVGVKEANLVVRNLRLCKVTDGNCDALIEEIDRLFGIETVIRKHGADLHNDWWTHTKESYYQFVDQNIKDNVTHKPWSCHATPPNRHNKHKE